LLRPSRARIASISFSRLPNSAFTWENTRCSRSSLALETCSSPFFSFSRLTHRSADMNSFTASTSLALSPNFSFTIAKGAFCMVSSKGGVIRPGWWPGVTRTGQKNGGALLRLWP